MTSRFNTGQWKCLTCGMEGNLNEKYEHDHFKLDTKCNAVVVRGRATFTYTDTRLLHSTGKKPRRQ